MRHEFSGSDDLRRMQGLVQRIWTPAQRFHIGDLAWGRYSVPGAEDPFRTSWWEREGEVVGWAWGETSGSVDLCVHPDHLDLLEEMLDWFEAAVGATSLSCMTMEHDTQTHETLTRRGYSAETEGPFFTRHSRDLVDLPEVELPQGYQIQTVRAEQADRRAEVHRAGWSDFGSRMSTECCARLMRTYPYQAETDLVVVAPDGVWVASALGWYDEVNAVGLVEPVSCRPEHRGRGLARAVDVALLHVFAALGATSSVILPRGDDAYPAPGRLYRSIGYVPGPRTIAFTRQRAA